MLAKLAGVPAVKAFDFVVGAPEALITELARLALIGRTENVALLGPSGVGTRSSGDRPGYRGVRPQIS